MMTTLSIFPIEARYNPYFQPLVDLSLSMAKMHIPYGMSSYFQISDSQISPTNEKHVKIEDKVRNF